MDRSGVDPAQVDDVVGGCVNQAGEQSNNVARNAWVAGGLPWHVPATSVDRQCGSSQQAIHFVAQGVIAGAYDLAIACGVESMTRSPMGSNASGGDGPFSGAWVEAVGGRHHPTQFEVSQILAERYEITREDMDAFSVESHRRAHENWENGHFARETVSVPRRDGEGNETGEMLERDEGIRPESTLETLAGLPSAANWDPEVAPDITAGNASQTSDGAAAMLIADRSVAESLGLTVRAAFRHFVVAAEDPWLVLSAPVPATKKLLDRSGMEIDDFDSMECNEAFAAIALMWAGSSSRAPVGRRGGEQVHGPLQPPGRRHRDRPPARGQRRAHHDHPPARPGGHRRSPSASRPCARAAARPTPR